MIGEWWRSVCGYVDPLPWVESSHSLLLLTRLFFHSHLSSVISYHSSPLQSREAWATVKYLRALWTLLFFASRHMCMFPLPGALLLQLATFLLPYYSLCSFPCVLSTCPLPWRALTPSVLHCAPNPTVALTTEMFTCSQPRCEFSSWPIETVYGENVMTHKRLKVKMPFYKEKYNCK